jgi:hypothetical protein
MRRPRLACLDFACDPRSAANLLVLLHALEPLCKLRDQRSFAGLETALSHDAPEKIDCRPLVRIVHGQQIFGRPARYKHDDVGFGGPVYDRQFAPLLNGVLDVADRVPVFGKQVRIELISVVGGNVDLARVRQNARKRWHFRGTRIGPSQGGNCREYHEADRHETKSFHINASLALDAFGEGDHGNSAKQFHFRKNVMEISEEFEHASTGSLALKQNQASPDALGHRLRAARGAQLPEN